jgi:hypothetical protein
MRRCAIVMCTLLVRGIFGLRLVKFIWCTVARHVLGPIQLTMLVLAYSIYALPNKPASATPIKNGLLSAMVTINCWILFAKGSLHILFHACLVFCFGTVAILLTALALGLSCVLSLVLLRRVITFVTQCGHVKKA